MAAEPALRLTIGIPTFDRPTQLSDAVQRLLPQLGAQDTLLVVDNASPVPAQDVIAPLVADWPLAQVRVVRHRVNLGGAANILRVVEEADADSWLWLLGDDDEIVPDAISRIRATVSEHPHLLFVNFAADNLNRTHSRHTSGLSEFIAGIDSWSNLNFMSVDVLRVSAVQPFLRRGYHFGYSMSPHVALVMSALGHAGSALFSHERLIARHEHGGWPPTLVLIGRPTILDLPPRSEDRARLAAVLRRETNLEYLTMYLVQEAERTGDSATALYQFDQLRGRLYGAGTPAALWLRLVIYRWLIRLPSLGRFTTRLALAVRGLVRGRTADAPPAIDHATVAARY